MDAALNTLNTNYADILLAPARYLIPATPTPPLAPVYPSNNRLVWALCWLFCPCSTVRAWPVCAGRCLAGGSGVDVSVTTVAQIQRFVSNKAALVLVSLFVLHVLGLLWTRTSTTA